MTTAPRHSLAAAVAETAVKAARDNLEQVLKREYPHGAAVEVVHTRGTYRGTVSGCSGSQVLVWNAGSQKVRGWHFTFVQLTKESH